MEQSSVSRVDDRDRAFAPLEDPRTVAERSPARAAETVGKIPPRINNFDLIRLLAAAQVLLIHGYEHFKLQGVSPACDHVIKAIRHVPGVPIFFTISGFLIAWSFDRSPNVRQYTRNRFLRLYPGLWVALAVTTAFLVGHGFLTAHNLTTAPVLAWFVAQITVGQFYTPGAFRGYGLGNPNGALATIVIELQFYALVPIVFQLSQTKRGRTWLLAGLAALSIAANFLIARLDPSELTSKLLVVSLAPYLFYFLTGTLAYLHWQRLGHFVCDRAPLFLSVFVAYSAVASGWLGLYYPTYWPNAYGLLGSILLSGATLAVAFSWRDVSHRLLRGTDLSYGVYIYHCIILNHMVQEGYLRHWRYMVPLTVLTVIAAVISWRFIEAPALRLKARPLRSAAEA
jgi:peptidoglycan/LPS O-acetylase OafA/YrhL